MINYCENCKQKILKFANIYLAFDSKCCSNLCRNNIIFENCKIDPRMLYPHKWIANKDKDIKNIEVTDFFYYNKKNI
tara:strand:- start:5405 stop:5635 length:231 start_codon:yes stop_codon:yes gene_type:complete